MLVPIDVPEAIGQDQEMMDKYNELTEWTESVHVLLNAIDEIKFEPTAERDLDDNLIKEIKTYLDAKGRLDW